MAETVDPRTCHFEKDPDNQGLCWLVHSVHSGTMDGHIVSMGRRPDIRDGGKVSLPDIVVEDSGVNEAVNWNTVSRGSSVGFVFLCGCVCVRDMGSTNRIHLDDGSVVGTGYNSCVLPADISEGYVTVGYGDERFVIRVSRGDTEDMVNISFLATSGDESAMRLFYDTLDRAEDVEEWQSRGWIGVLRDFHTQVPRIWMVDDRPAAGATDISPCKVLLGDGVILDVRRFPYAASEGDCTTLCIGTAEFEWGSDGGRGVIYVTNTGENDTMTVDGVPIGRDKVEIYPGMNVSIDGKRYYLFCGQAITDEQLSVDSETYPHELLVVCREE